MGFQLLNDFISAESLVANLPPKPKRSPPPPVWRTVAPFQGGEYGDGYLTFDVNMEILPAKAPVDVDAEGWHFGILVNSGVSGWYPPAFVQ